MDVAGDVVGWIGLGLAGLGAFLLLVAIVVSIQRSRETILDGFDETSLTRIGEAPEGLVQVRGVVRAGDAGTTTEPISGVDVAWYRLDASRRIRLTEGGSKTKHFYTERDRRPFLLDDGSAGPALIDVESAGFVTDLHVYRDVPIHVGVGELPGTQHQLDPAAANAILERSGHAARNVGEASVRMVPIGVEATVVGWLRRGPSGPTITGSGDQLATVYTVDAETIRTDRAERTRNRWGIAIVGLLMIAGGLALFTQV